MKELQYPFDSDHILSKKKSIRKKLYSQSVDFLQKKVAILGGSTTSDIKLILELFLLEQGIKPEFYESEYNQYYQEAMFSNTALEKFRPDIIYIYTTNRNIIKYPDILDSEENVEVLIQTEIQKYTGIWERLTQVYQCPIIQNNFELPFYRLLGNKDASDIHGAVNFITRLNMEFYQKAKEYANLYICDINYISADYGLKEWSDPFYWYMYKYALNVSAIPYLAYNVANIIKSIFGKNKKGLVLDLDNTLWGGVIGDDGVDNIVLGPETSEGQAYLEFQQYIKALSRCGIVLNVNSKNDYENAVSGLQHPDGELKLEDFAEIKANWNAKNINFQEIAGNLNLLPESLVFVDDNPAERAIVSETLDVCAPDINEVQHYIQTIDRAGYFEVTSLSEDDLNRKEMYQENVQRRKLESSFENYEEYLLSLEMNGTIRPFEPIYMSRIAQLTNKSNQFNLTTKRYTQEEIEQIASDGSRITLYGKLADKFGDNGVVSVVIGNIVGEECHMELWIMSCRVLKRDMEFAMFDILVKNCIERGVKKIFGYYYPTAKNGMVKEFYGNMGFELMELSEKQSVWRFDITKEYINKNKVIKVEV